MLHVLLLSTVRPPIGSRDDDENNDPWKPSIEVAENCNTANDNIISTAIESVVTLFA